MAKISFEKIASQVIGATCDNGLMKFNTKNWIHQNKCFVCDYVMHGMVFSLDVTPEDDGSVSLDFVPRTPVTIGKFLGLSHSKKFSMRRRISLSECCDEIINLSHLIKAEAKLNGVDLGQNPWGIPVSGKPTKVGILTLPMINNFGGNLQAYALMEVLKLSGHKPVMINRRWAPQGYKDDPNDPKENILYSTSYALQDGVENAKFVDAKILPATRPYYAATDIKRNYKKYKFDCLLVGSDQAWRPKYAHGLISDFFFKFAMEDESNIRRVSYAVSFGADSWEYSSELTGLSKEWVSKFDAISVREDVAVGMCRDQYGRDVEHTLDPTLLLPPARYLDLVKFVPKDSSSRIVTYVLDPSREKKALLARISEHLGLPVRSTNGAEYVGGDPLAGGDGNNSVEKWVKSISEAEFVITDSFHGMVFSILFNRPFIAYGNPDRGMARFTSLLKMFGLEDRLVTDPKAVNIDAMMAPVDWDKVNAKIAQEREKSLA